MTSSIHLTEIFYSIQGEGYHSGKAAIFIRTSGCNLSCRFCDTDFSLKLKMSATQILEQIQFFPSKFVVLTGGEPTLQYKVLTPLIKLLQKHNYFIAMETNGTSLNIMGVDWVTVSPKIGEKGDWILKKGNELKLIFENQDLKFYQQSEFDHYYLQPKEIRTEQWGKGKRLQKETQTEWLKTLKVVKDNPLWSYSFQIHKELKIH